MVRTYMPIYIACTHSFVKLKVIIVCLCTSQKSGVGVNGFSNLEMKDGQCAYDCRTQVPTWLALLATAAAAAGDRLEGQRLAAGVLIGGLGCAGFT